MLHSWDKGKTWNTGGFEASHFRPLRGLIESRSLRRIVETGSGASTIFFLLLNPEFLVSIDPVDDVYRRVKAYCDTKAISLANHEMHLRRSELVLPEIARDRAGQFDLALIDGDHAWPTVFVDFCYCNMLLRKGRRSAIGCCCPHFSCVCLLPYAFDFSNLAHRPGIPGYPLIRGQQGDTLHRRLGNEHAIKGILVQRRQAVDEHRMSAHDREFFVAVLQQATAQQPRVDDEIVAAEHALDGDFPQTRGAEHRLVAGVLHQTPCHRGQATRNASSPEQQMSIQYKLHGSLNSRSMRSAAIVSKSSGT
jgi:hypothetical protein